MKLLTILSVNLLFIALILPSAEARFGGRGNKCARIGLSLSATKADLLAGSKRIDVGDVSLSIVHGKLVAKLNVIHGCSLSDVRVNVFPGSSLGFANPSSFPCKKRVRHATSTTVLCPIKKFRIPDCCAEHFVIVVFAIVKCKGVPHIYKEPVYAGGPQCTKHHGIPCSFVPVKLIPECGGKGCIHNTPFVVVCKRNRCVKIPQKPCEGKKCDHNTPLLNKCVDGVCKDIPQEPCEGKKCEHNTPVLNKCVGGYCEYVPQEPCAGKSCKGNTPFLSKCFDGVCKEILGRQCRAFCKAHFLIIGSKCTEGHCKRFISRCGRCEFCKYTSSGAICVKKICAPHEVLDYKRCKCIPKH